jgi:hypothetical protein
VTIGRDEVLARLQDAYKTFLSKDTQLLELDVNERSITHKLAEYLQREFPDWHVDCEYNRVRDLPKRLVGSIVSTHTDDTDGKTVYPDIIVHRRCSQENLLVIEAKKSTTAADSDDISKLKAYKSEHGYKFAYAVTFQVGADAGKADVGHDLYEVQL